jgi:PAS domain S-box-containing protein
MVELHRIFNLSIDMLGVAGADGHMRAVNDAWHRALGFTPDELCAAPYIDFIHPDDRAAASSAAGGPRGDLVLEIRFRRKDSGYRWIEWSAAPWPEEDLVYILARDVTARKEEEAARLASIERLRAMFENAADVIMLLDRDLRIQEINHIFPHLTPEMVLGRSAYDFLPPEDVDVARRALEAALRYGEPTRYETRGPAPGGGVAWYGVAVGPVRRGGEVVALTLTTIAISERKRLEEDLRVALQRVETYAEDLSHKNRELEAEIAERRRAEATLDAQRRTIVAMSTPIIKAWRGVLVLPVIGLVDAQRASLITERLLAEIVARGARFAILDLTGVDEVDAGTASHMMGIARAAALLGSRCLVSGMSAAVARAIVDSGESMGDLETFGELEDALRSAQARLDRRGARGALR